MQTTTTLVISPATCPFKFKGQNLFEFRRCKLQQMAKALGLEYMTDKNTLLTQIIGRLHALDAPEEIAEMKALKPKAKKTSKKRAKKRT